MKKLDFLKMEIVKQLKLNNSDCLLIDNTGSMYAFFEVNYICSRGELNFYNSMVKKDDIQKEIIRIENNHPNGLSVLFCDYKNLTMQKILNVKNS